MYLFQSSPSPIVQALDAAIRQDLQNNRDSYFFWLLISAAVVVVGVALEGPELVYETVNIVRRRCLRKKALPTPDWVRLVALLGWCLVVLGVAGEVVAERFMSLADGNLQTFNDILLAEARKEAGDAKASALSAEASARVIGEQAAILEATVKRLIWQGPRDILLFNAEQSFNSLREFSGQKFRFSICGPDINLAFGNIGLTEIGRTQQSIFVSLRNAGWKLVTPLGLPSNPPFPYIADSCASVGVSVNTSDSATRQTRDAAKALQLVINKALSDTVKVGDGKILLFPPLPALAPDIIDVHVGLHPAKPMATKQK